MSNIHLHSVTKDPDHCWLYGRHDDNMMDIFRKIPTKSLQHAEAVAAKALQLIINGGYEKSSMISYNTTCCVVDLHVLVQGEITEEYYELAQAIDEAATHVQF